MILKVKLALPHRKSVVPADTLVELVKIGARKRLADLGNPLDTLFHTNRSFKHLPCRAAAAVTVAVGHQNIIVDILVLIAHPAAHDRIGMKHSVVCREEIFDWLIHAQCRDQVRQHLRAVNPSPPHCVIGNLVKLVPRKLGGHKIVDSAFFHNLRQRTGIPKHVRQPQNAVVHAKLFLEKALAVHKLTHKGLA